MRKPPSQIRGAGGLWSVSVQPPGSHRCATSTEDLRIVERQDVRLRGVRAERLNSLMIFELLLAGGSRATTAAAAGEAVVGP
jgi:hypothetical protein